MYPQVPVDCNRQRHCKHDAEPEKSHCEGIQVILLEMKISIRIAFNNLGQIKFPRCFNTHQQFDNHTDGADTNGAEPSNGNPQKWLGPLLALG